ncbi:hypothetical protein [Microbacterium esteraromaticum]|uniref:hypothetical protein n=1 Tax=Microbacterium esteraromaticum TaxID=57043 RepID=UPI001C988E5C|nr:hypothetical protein [Microbacterium esteraromaticum]MBY6061605.1 hypothetical protein [Microbacterium esteraromaticum]
MDAFDSEDAAQIAQIARDLNTRQPVGIMLINPSLSAGEAYEIDADLARAVATRLQCLADELEQAQGCTLRRLQIVDDEFLDRDGGV